MFILSTKTHFASGNAKGRHILCRLKSPEYCLDEILVRLDVNRINKKFFNCILNGVQH